MGVGGSVGRLGAAMSRRKETQGTAFLYVHQKSRTGGPAYKSGVYICLMIVLYHSLPSAPQRTPCPVAAFCMYR